MKTFLFIFGILIYTSSAQAGQYVFETKFTYKCENTDYKKTLMRCSQVGKKAIFVYTKTKNKEILNYRDYRVVDILEYFKMAGGVSFKIMVKDAPTYKGCSFLRNSFDFNCVQKKQ